MKTTIVIADDLFARARELARKRGTTLRALTEEGLRRVLEAAASTSPERRELPPLGTYPDGGGSAGPLDWEQIRDTIYQGRGS